MHEALFLLVETFSESLLQRDLCRNSGDSFNDCVLLRHFRQDNQEITQFSDIKVLLGQAALFA